MPEMFLFAAGASSVLQQAFEGEHCSGWRGIVTWCGKEYKSEGKGILDDI